MKRIYLACPYSNKDKTVELYRFNKVNEIAAKLMMKGFAVFSPISHSVPIAEHIPGSNNDHDFWLGQDREFIDICDEMYVLCLGGWHDSFGVNWEIKYVKKQGKPITYIDGECNVI